MSKRSRNNTPLTEEQSLFVAEHAELARRYAKRIRRKYPNSVSLDDVHAACLTGLVLAVRNFEPERGFKFSTFAIPRMRGAVLDYLRDIQHGTRTTPVDTPRSIEVTVYDNGDRPITLGHFLEDRQPECVRLMELRDNLDDLVARIPEKKQLWRQIIQWYYVEGLTMKQIGKILGLSESRVSQMHSRVIVFLRDECPRERVLDALVA